MNPYDLLHIYYFQTIPEIADNVREDPNFLGTWEEADMAFAFFNAPSKALVQQILDQNPDTCLVDTYEMTGEEWHGDKITPYYVHDLCIHPPWQAPEHGCADEKRIIMDPGVVFGTGRHQTTEDCLDLIHRLFSKEQINSVLDIGTGTGLLSLGAAALGCPAVMACDFNLLAVQTCQHNIFLNGFESRILAFQARGEQILAISCDLLVANIHYDVMKIMIETPAFLDKKWFVLSGLLNSETRKILDSLSFKPVHIIERRCPDGVWNTLLGKSTRE